MDTSSRTPPLRRAAWRRVHRHANLLTAVFQCATAEARGQRVEAAVGSPIRAADSTACYALLEVGAMASASTAALIGASAVVPFDRVAEAVDLRDCRRRTVARRSPLRRSLPSSATGQSA